MAIKSFWRQTDEYHNILRSIYPNGPSTSKWGSFSAVKELMYRTIWSADSDQWMVERLAEKTNHKNEWAAKRSKLACRNSTIRKSLLAIYSPPRKVRIVVYNPHFVLTTLKLTIDGDLSAFVKSIEDIRATGTDDIATVLNEYKDGHQRIALHFSASKGRRKTTEFILQNAPK